MKNKIHDYKGKLYYICPFLDKIGVIIEQSYANKTAISLEEIFEIRRHSQSIREIGSTLRGIEVPGGKLNVEKIYQPYEFSAIIKNLKIKIKAGRTVTEELIDELTKTYL